MSRILFAWELGGNLGHITRLLVLGRALRERGHDVTFALRNIRHCAALLQQEGFAFLQAPLLRSPRASGLPGDPASYPEILLHAGFADPQSLTTALLAWRSIFRVVDADLLVFDYSPTALLAAHGTGLPRVLFGTGFASPPRISPMPGIRPWQRIPAERLEANECRALESANTALRSVGAPRLTALHAMLNVEADFLATLPELDHYRGRSDGEYVGPMHGERGREAVWPAGEGKKLFVYLRPNSPAFGPLAKELRMAALSTLWFAPDLSPQLAAELQSPSLRFVALPLAISDIAAADAAICHAGHGTTAALLLAGVPLLLIPDNVEQMLLARNVASLGAAAVVTPEMLRHGFGQSVSQFFANDIVRTRAKAFAAKYKGLSSSQQLGLIISKIETLVTGRPRRSADAQGATP